jgi:hypothetical protein
MRYHPGMLAVATVRGTPDTIVIRTWHGWRYGRWCTVTPIDGHTTHPDDVVTDIRLAEPAEDTE